jgi:heme exporter protein C
MRQKLLYAICIVAALIVVRDLIVMMTVFPDEAAQGAIYRIIFFHVPAAWTALLACFLALIASVMLLATKNLRWDALAVSVTEVGLAFGAANLITGMIWGRVIWGIWWAWDVRLTTMLVGWLMYAGYLMLRRAIEEPTERAKMSAVVSIFAFADVPIIFFSIRWWRHQQHPPPADLPPEWWAALFMNWIPLLLLAGVFLMIRMEQERIERQLNGLRRTVHAF